MLSCHCGGNKQGKREHVTLKNKIMIKTPVTTLALAVALSFWASFPGIQVSANEQERAFMTEDESLLDAGFGTSGKVVTPAGSGNEVAQAVAIQPDGKIVVAGYAFNGTNNDFAVIRYNSNGTLDDTFDGTTNANGVILTPIGQSEDEAFGVAIQPDGKIVLVGQTYDGVKTSLAIARYNSDGTLDMSFDGDGRAVISPSIGNAMLRSVAVRPDGRILATGSASNGVNFDIVVVQLNADGTLDAAFDGNSGNGNGIVVTPVGAGNDQGYGVVIQPDALVVVAGYYTSPTSTDSVLLRYATDGRLDTSFSGDGIATHAFSPDTDEALALALAPDGRIVISGCIRNGAPNDFLIGRFMPDGSPDASFGTNGRAIFPFSGTVDIALGVAVQPDGKVVAAGFGNNGVNNDFGVVRLNSDGTPDLTFGGDGGVLTAIGSSADQANAVAIQPNGRIVVAGRTAGTTADIAVVRYYQASTASITGRVFRPNGSPLGSTRVSLIDENGLTQTATTSSFGIYQFSGVSVGRTYTIRASSKRYRFAPIIVNVVESLANMDLTGLD